jgi:hypothetical protein
VLQLQEFRPTSALWRTGRVLVGLPVICIDARHAKAVLKMQIKGIHEWLYSISATFGGSRSPSGSLGSR